VYRAISHMSVFQVGWNRSGTQRQNAIRTELGQYAILATWANVQTMRLHDVGFSIRVLERARSGRSLPEEHLTLYQTSAGRIGTPTVHLTFEGELKSAHIRDVGQRREVDSRITSGDTHLQHC
jgi:hypothetical protein